MKPMFARLVAIMLLIIPGFAATYGFLEMKDAIFTYASHFGNEQVEPQFAWFTFLKGLVLFALGVSFIGGWILFRDRKRNYVAARFKKKKKRPPRTSS